MPIKERTLNFPLESIRPYLPTPQGSIEYDERLSPRAPISSYVPSAAEVLIPNNLEGSFQDDKAKSLLSGSPRSFAGAFDARDKLKDTRLKIKNYDGNNYHSPLVDRYSFVHPKSSIWARLTSRTDPNAKTIYRKIDDATRPKDLIGYDAVLVAASPNATEKNIASFFPDGMYGTKNVIDTELEPDWNFRLKESEIGNDNYRIAESDYDNKRMHDLDEGLRYIFNDVGIGNDTLIRAGITGGYDGLDLGTAEVLLGIQDNTNLSKDEKIAIQNALDLFYGQMNTAQTQDVIADMVKQGAANHNQYYNPQIALEESYKDSQGNIVWRPSTRKFSNGGRLNTSNRFANGGRMSRKASEATRGNARLVKKREEDDDDAYFQDTPRGGSDIDTLAVRVMRGELGTGEQLRRNLGTKYQAVQRRVKQLRASQGGMMGDDVDEFSDDELSENAFANGGRLSRITRPNDKRYEIYF